MRILNIIVYQMHCACEKGQLYRLLTTISSKTQTIRCCCSCLVVGRQRLSCAPQQHSAQIVFLGGDFLYPLRPASMYNVLSPATCAVPVRHLGSEVCTAEAALLPRWRRPHQHQPGTQAQSQSTDRQPLLHTATSAHTHFCTQPLATHPRSSVLP